MPFPDIRIVLSTSWVEVFNSFTKVTRRLPEALRARVVGSTYHSRMDAAVFGQVPRGIQIVTDVRRRQPAGWLALDDDDEGWPAWCRDRLIHTDPVLGISAAAVLAEFQEKLAHGMASRPDQCLGQAT
jgi:HAD domain in Swiss Army Knife RNA repair proteins